MSYFQDALQVSSPGERKALLQDLRVDATL